MAQRANTVSAELEQVDGVAPGGGLGKHRKMATSPFVFLRGSASLFYADLASGALRLPKAARDWPLTTVMGDCHVSNFGFITEEGSHGDRVVFAPNDFDDACVGHALWDLARYLVSLVLSADHARGMGSGDYPADKPVADKPVVEARQTRKAMDAFLHAYASTCDQAVAGRAHYEAAETAFAGKHMLAKRYRKAVARAPGGADFETRSTLAKAVAIDQQPLRFRDRPERFRRLDAATRAKASRHLAPYMDDAILDLVQRLDAGTGSVNMDRYYALVGPRDYADRAELALCHIVEVKQQRQAAPLRHFPGLNPTNRLDPAHLTVICQRRMQRDPDLVLDDLDWDDSHWLVRSRHHARVGIDPEHIAIGKRAVRKGGFAQYAATCGRALALAHARGDRRSTRFEQAVADTLPALADTLIEACGAYAETVKADCHDLARREGLI